MYRTQAVCTTGQELLKCSAGSPPTPVADVHALSAGNDARHAYDMLSRVAGSGGEEPGGPDDGGSCGGVPRYRARGRTGRTVGCLLKARQLLFLTRAEGQVRPNDYLTLTTVRAQDASLRRKPGTGDRRPRRRDTHCARPHSSLETPRRPPDSPALLIACTTLDTRSRVTNRPRHMNKRTACEGRSPGRRCSQRPGARHEQRCAPGLWQGARTLSRIRFLEHGRTSRSLRHAGRFSSAAVTAVRRPCICR